MKSFRTVIYVLLVLGVLAFLLAREHRERTVSSEEINSPAEAALVEAKDAGLPAWSFVHSENCEPCARLKEVYEKLEPQYEGKVSFISVSTSDQAERPLLDHFGMKFVPTSVFIDKNGKMIEKTVGFIPESQVEGKLDRLIGK